MLQTDGDGTSVPSGNVAGRADSPSIFEFDKLAQPLINVFKNASNLLVPLAQMEKSGENLTETFGYLGNRISEMEVGINKSADAVLKLSKGAMTFEEALKRASEIQVEISKTTGRNVIANSQIISELELASQATNVSTKDLASNFTAVGYQLTAVNDEMGKVANTAYKLGLNVGQVSQAVVNNMKLMNVYNFQNGIEGLTKMVGKSIVLGANMTKVMDIAEKAFDPEQAITLASDLQRLGVVTSDLLDPLKIMDLGQNNPEELLNQVKNITKGLVEVDEKSGKVRILPGQQLALRNIAGALNMTKEELAELAIKSGEIEYKMSRIKFSPEISEDSREMVANLAQFGKDFEGREGFVVTLKDQATGESFQKLVTDLKEKDIKFLEEQQKPKKLEEFAQEQLTVSQRMLKALESIASTPRATALRSGIAAQYKTQAEFVTKELSRTERNVGEDKTTREKMIEAFGNLPGDLQKAFSDSIKTIMTGFAAGTLNEETIKNLANNFKLETSSSLGTIGTELKGIIDRTATLAMEASTSGRNPSPVVNPPPAPPPAPPTPRTTSNTGTNAFDQILDLYRRGLQNPRPLNEPPIVIPPRENTNVPQIPDIPERPKTGAELINPQIPTNDVDVRNINDFASIFNIESINDTATQNTQKMLDKLSEIQNTFITSRSSAMVVPNEIKTNNINPEKLYAAEFSKIAETYKQTLAENKKSEIPNELPITIGDGIIGPDGGLIVSGKKGTYSLDKQDSVIAGNFDKPNTSAKNDDDIKPTIEKPSITNIEIPKEFKISNVDDLANLVDITPLKDTLQKNNNLLQQGFSNLDTTLKNEQKDVVLNPNIDVESPKLPEVVLNGVPFPETINIGNVDSFSQVFDNKSVIDALSLQDNKFAGNISELQNTIESTQKEVKQPITNVDVNVPKQEQDTKSIDFKFPNEIAISNTKDLQSTLNLNPLNESIINNGNEIAQSIFELEQAFLEKYNKPIESKTPKLFDTFGKQENFTPSRKIDFAQSNTDFIKQVRTTFEEFEKTFPKLENETEKLIVPQTEENNLFDYDEFAQSMNNNLKVSLEQQTATYVPPPPTDNNLEKIEQVSKTVNENKLDMAGKVEFVVRVEGSNENPQMAASFKNLLEREFRDNGVLTDIMMKNASLRGNSAGLLSGKPQTSPFG